MERLELDRRYQEIVNQLCIASDECIRYLVSYSNDLAEHGVRLPHIMFKV
ncbi:hypothetical protein [Pseudolactococcus paracarnosus]|uniref:Uncharacterized protein n=1 Tax=Pseudolactococcus paracarnosus TaxID=2749962 RepID=A0ABT0AKB8_9LACT|nr:hypothetical protein [Lactococcus paracarnosus]MCJ1976970.1 hypothetical protein [Lactococcus paracarnosus]MCJ1983381.1 hypothetical protein [Lactococcus paracarnosus]MCJ1993656.1 hypothetical protein [Lactococcus paracarnosus]MCJ1998757.1 hypothetical protein [Lactococcus paracarnosus]